MVTKALFKLDDFRQNRSTLYGNLLSCIIYLYLFFKLCQLTGRIENMKIGILKEGFGLKNSELDVDKMVREAAEQLGSKCGAVVEEVSVPMHSDGNEMLISV